MSEQQHTIYSLVGSLKEQVAIQDEEIETLRHILKFVKVELHNTQRAIDQVVAHYEVAPIAIETTPPETV